MVSSLPLKWIDFFSLSFVFLFSSFQGAGGTKYWVTAFGKVEHHSFSSFVPILQVGLSEYVPLHFFSDPGPQNDQRPRKESASIIRNCNRIRNTYFCVLNLFENSQCSESWKFFPPELHRLSIDSIQICEEAVRSHLWSDHWFLSDPWSTFQSLGISVSQTWGVYFW